MKKIVFAILIGLSFHGFSQCDLKLTDKIKDKIKEDGVTQLKDFMASFKTEKDSVRRYSLVLKDGFKYRLYLFESDLYPGRASFKLFEKNNMLLGTTYIAKTGKAFPYFDFMCKKTAVYNLEIKKEKGAKYCAQGILAFVKAYNSDGSSVVTPEKGKDVFVIVEDMPKFTKNNQKNSFRLWINQQVKYPKEAIKKNIQGTVLVTFIVNEKGYVENIEVIKSVSQELDQEAKRAVESSPKWYKPGYQRGKAVKVMFTIPIDFMLK